MAAQFGLFIVIFSFFGAAVSQSLLNQCPQPTEANPNPPAFLYEHPDDCRFYFTCAHGKPRLMQCKPQDRTRYSEYYHTCVGVGTVFDTCTRSNAQRECKRGFPGLIGHPTACHRFYNCTRGLIHVDSGLGEYEDECPYPLLFDINDRMCKHANEASCGSQRKAPKDACDYIKNACTGPRCQPCGSSRPSCLGLPDGYHAFPGKHWTPMYIHCDSERFVKKLTCSLDKRTGIMMVFSPEDRKCVAR